MNFFFEKHFPSAIDRWHNVFIWNILQWMWFGWYSFFLKYEKFLNQQTAWWLLDMSKEFCSINEWPDLLILVFFWFWLADHNWLIDRLKNGQTWHCGPTLQPDNNNNNNNNKPSSIKQAGSYSWLDPFTCMHAYKKNGSMLFALTETIHVCVCVIYQRE
mgnify:CR=1 FL=1